MIGINATKQRVAFRSMIREDHPVRVFGGNTGYELSAVIREDSVYYELIQQCPTNGKNDIHIPKYIPEAVSSSDIVNLEREFEREYNAESPRPTGDSTLIFWGTVERDGVLRNLRLLVGAPSAFSDYISKKLGETDYPWVPMLQGGRAVSSVVDIYVRLNRDNTFKISTSGKFRKDIQLVETD